MAAAVAAAVAGGGGKEAGGPLVAHDVQPPKIFYLHMHGQRFYLFTLTAVAPQGRKRFLCGGI